MIYYFTPYGIDGKLGKAYNDSCAIVPNDEDWICLMDGDTAFLSVTWGRQIAQVIKENPHVDVFTCWATRIGSKVQRYAGQISEERDVVKLKEMVLKCEQENFGKITVVNREVSGLLLVFRKSLWKQFPFAEETPAGTILGIDTEWTNRLLASGKTIARMDGLLLFHYYRLAEGRKYKEHLKV
jgi:hypothetical protein